jgi:hypothetical protein
MYVGEGTETRIELPDGNHNYTNGFDPARANWYNTGLPGTLLYQWNGFSSLQGVFYYSFGRYRLIPRNTGDFGTPIGIQNLGESPSVFWLRQNFPNPFNPVTKIVYNLPSTSSLTVKVYNLLGQEVKTLIDGSQNRGLHTIDFDGSNLASGLYIYVLEGESVEGQNFRDQKKMVIVK